MWKRELIRNKIYAVLMVLASLPVVILERCRCISMSIAFFSAADITAPNTLFPAFFTFMNGSSHDPVFFCEEHWNSEEKRKEKDRTTARRVRSKAYPRDRRSGSVGAA